MILLIYKVLNKENNKSYVGQTNRSLRRRKVDHYAAAKAGSPFFFHRALRKYDKDSFSWDILFECFDREEANRIEEFFIYNLKSKAPDGYNLTNGGEGTNGHLVSLEARQKLYLAHKGKPLSKEHKEAIGISGKGRKHSEETKEKLKLAAQKRILKTPMLKGEFCGSSKLTKEQVKQILISTDTQCNLAREYGITQTNVSCIKKRKTWKHVEV